MNNIDKMITKNGRSKYAYITMVINNDIYGSG
jgi:hypothetical protein